MSQYNWNWWFVLSVFWVLIHLMLAMMDESKQIVTHWFFVFGMVLSMLNLLFCVYIGNHPDTRE